jgi:hypothetical protein
MGARKVDQIYWFLAELREKSLRDSREENGEAEGSDVESYKGVKRIRKGQAEESSKVIGVLVSVREAWSPAMVFSRAGIRTLQGK